MLLFKYKVVDSKGVPYKGLVEALTVKEAQMMLGAQGFEVLSLHPTGYWQQQLARLQRVSSKDMVILSRQLSILVGADLPLVDALNTLSRQTQNDHLKVVVAQVADKVEGGKKLSESLAEHPAIFDDFYIKLIETGERVGKLDEVLEYLAVEQEKNYDLQSRIKGMLIYPAFIFSTMVVIIIFMLSFVMPRMLGILKESGVELPLSTRLLIGVSNFFQVYWWAVLFGVIGFGAFFIWYISTSTGRRQWDLLKLNFPVVGKIIQQVAIVRFSNSLSLLLRGGVDMVSSLKTVSGVLGSSEYQRLMVLAIQSVEDGNLLASSLAKSRYIPYMVIQIIQVGEKTGRIEKSLDKISTFYTREVNNTIGSLVSLIEPVVIIVMGVGVGVVVSAMILPMYRLAGGL
ncbi:type II secretion system F family protein [Candidatus Falkowbacteria bacterium]|nr:type II secretion system F family protein [Candidatus Falkowbacteria bacterium]